MILNMPDLSTKYLGLPIRCPLIVGSSGLTNNVDNIKKMEGYGAGAVVLKSLFEEAILMEMEAKKKQMASQQFLYPETLEFYENQDSGKLTTEVYLKLITDCKKKVEIPIIASINCLTAGQWTYFPKRIEEVGADALELNLFILPSDFSHSAEENEKVYFDIINQVREQVNIPVSVKISFYFSNLGNMIQRLSETGIEGIVLFNRFFSPDFDLDKLEITSSNLFSSPDDLYISLRWMAIMYNRVKCDLAASTGVHDSMGLIKQILAGASVVQVVSCLHKEGLDEIQSMVEGLETWMIGNGFYTINDFKGRLSQSASENPAAYERVQFMKYFSGYQQ